MTDNTLFNLLQEASFKANLNTIHDLVVNKKIFSFYYEGDEAGDPGHEEKGWRKSVKPVCYGKGFVDNTGKAHNTDKTYVRMFIGPGSKSATDKSGKNPLPGEGWRLFRVDRMKNWIIGNKNFTSPPDSRFNANSDKNIYQIMAISDFTPGESDDPADLKNPSGVPPKPGKPDDKKKLPKKPAPRPGASSTPSDKPEDDQEVPQDKAPTKQHYSSTRTPKPVVKVRNGKPVVRTKVGEGKPVIRMRENNNFISLLKEILLNSKK